MNRILMQWLLVTVLVLGTVGTTAYGSNLLGPAPPWPDDCVVITAKEKEIGLSKPTHLYRVDVNRVDVDGKAVRLDSDKPFSQPQHPYFVPDGRDGWLYFDAKIVKGQRFIWAINVNGRTVQLTSDPWGEGIDRNPQVSIQQKHLLFRTQRTGMWQTALAEDGLTQGPGFGIDVPFLYPEVWSATHPDRLWYPKLPEITATAENAATFAEYDVVNKVDTGQTVTLKGISYFSRISISPDGAFLAMQQSNKRVVVFDFAGQQRVEFPVNCNMTPTWSSRDTVVFSNPSDLRAIYRGNLATGQVTRIPVQGLREVDEIVDIVAWPGSSRK